MKRTDEDQYLDQLLSSYRNESVSGLQIQKWKKAVALEASHEHKRNWRWLQLAAAGVIGFSMGAVFFQSRADHVQMASDQGNLENTTIEYVVTKLD